MMQTGLIFAVITAFSFGLWTVFHSQAAPHINPFFGAIIVSLTAVALGTAFLLPQIKVTRLFTDEKGILFVALAGICAFGIDFFALKTYGSGMAISIAAPLIIGGGIAVASVVGLIALGESLSFMKILGITLILTGAGILASL